jgi:hypothetical protein
MTDIVKRLRDPYERSAWGSTLYSEAADEIEMLRRIVATAATWTAAPGTTIAELRATLEPLRLGSSTADQPDGGPDEEDGPWAEGWAERSGTPDQQTIVQPEAALLREAVMLLFDWDALIGGSGSVATETRAFLDKVGYDPMTATMKADQQSARKGLDELTRMAQEDGLYDGPDQRKVCDKCGRTPGNPVERDSDGVVMIGAACRKCGMLLRMPPDKT